MTIVSAQEASIPASGIEDAQPQIQAILDQGISIDLGPGDYLLRRGIRFRKSGQRLIGAGIGGSRSTMRTRLIVMPPDNSRRGYQGNDPVIHVDQQFCSVREMEIAFAQPLGFASPTLDDAIRYPAAIYVRSPGLQVEDVMISGAWEGISGAEDDDDRSANPGRAHFERVYVGSLRHGIRLDAAHGTVNVIHCHAWPFGFTMGGWLDMWGGNTSFQFGSIDNLQMSDVISFRSIVRFTAEPFKGTSLMRGPIGTFSGLTLDGSLSQLQMDSGRMNGAHVYKSTGVEVDEPNIDISGDAELCLHGLNLVNTKDAGPFVTARGQARLALTGAIISATANPHDYTVLEVADRASLTATAVNFESAVNDPRCTFLRQRGGGQFTLLGCRGRALASNTHGASMVDIERPDLPHVMAGNAFPGFA